MNSQVLWFEWTKDEPIVPEDIYNAVVDGGMGLQELRLLGEFEFGDGWLQLANDMSAKFDYGGKKIADGKYDIEVIGYFPDETVEVYRIQEFKQPEIYQSE